MKVVVREEGSTDLPVEFEAFRKTWSCGSILQRLALTRPSSMASLHSLPHAVTRHRTFDVAHHRSPTLYPPLHSSAFTRTSSIACGSKHLPALVNDGVSLRRKTAELSGGILQ